MTRLVVTLEPHGSLLIGGYAAATGSADADTARDAQGILIPGSSVKGALREAATRIVRGLRRGNDLLSRLFGEEEGDAGLVSVGSLRPVAHGGVEKVEATALSLSLRHHVSLERWTRQAAPGLLFEERVTGSVPGLVFQGPMWTLRSLSEDERGLLFAAATLTDQIGAGRGRGLGLVRVTLTPDGEGDTPAPIDLPSGPSTRVLVLEAEEPLHLAAVKDQGNYTPSRDTLDGSTVRGAIAAALAGIATEDVLEEVFGGASPAIFGDGRPGGVGAIPAPATLRESKLGGVVSDDAVALCAESLGGQPFERPADTRYAKGGSYLPTSEGWAVVPVVRRTVTRAARDHASGRAADARLYTLEVVDPFLGKGTAAKPLRFFAPVTGDQGQLRWILTAVVDGLRVGGDRSRGFGRLRFVSHEAPAPLPGLPERHQAWSEQVGRRGVDRPESTGVLLALGWLALRQDELEQGLASCGLELVDGVARRQIHGGWNAGVRLPRTVTSKFQAGSTFIVRRSDGQSALAALAALESRGLGPGRADGWGLLVACHPIHVDLSKED
jgi:CRISPR/Cas system CSM-associated protein Csm3 (group 7 of RAMP superfamily)